MPRRTLFASMCGPGLAYPVCWCFCESSIESGPGHASLTVHASLSLYELCLRIPPKYSSATKIDSVATGDVSEIPRH
jgi:hypothetical protein